MAGNSTDPGRSVTSKVTAILMSFADGGIHTLTDVATAADLPTSTAHRLASELVAWRLLERTEDRSYRIAFPLRMIGSENAELCSHTLMVRRALPVLEELSRATRGEVRLGILRGCDVQILQAPRCVNRDAEPIHAESLQHSTVPAHAAASGKALLAFAAPAVIDRVIDAGLAAFTPHTITSPDVLRQKLATIRLTQVATSRNEFKCGTAAIAMPIFYGRGRTLAAVELNVAHLGTELKPAASALAVACRSLSRQLATELHLPAHPG